MDEMNVNQAIGERWNKTMNRLAKWRAVFAGWQLGTRQKGDPECDAVRDQREALMMLRVEASALAVLLMNKGVFTADEYFAVQADEAERLMLAYEKKFPGLKATDYGVNFGPESANTMKGWRP